MFYSLRYYFVQPLLKVLYAIVVSVVCLNFEELKTNLFFRLPFVLRIGPFPFLCDFWVKWYLFEDKLMWKILGVFEPATTIKRMIKNPLCSNEIVFYYNKEITSNEARIKRTKEIIEQI